MRHLAGVLLGLGSITVLAVSLGAGAKAPAGGRAGLDRLVDRFFDECYFPHHPTAATAAGFHQYDARLEDATRAGVRKEIACQRGFEKRFAAIDPRTLDATAQDDRALVLGTIRAVLLELETIKMWERNPDQYSSGLASSVFVIMSRNFAPQEERLASVIARQQLMPAVLDAARANLVNPPRVYTEVALEQIDGIIGFFRSSVPAAFDKVRDAALLGRFQASNQAVLAALERYKVFLKDDLLPRSRGDFRIGAENFRKKLLHEEMVDLPLDRLLAIGRADLERNQEAFRRTAAAIDPSRDAMAVFADLEKDHPAPDGLLQAFRDTLGGLRSFIEERHIVTIPSTVPPRLEETPPFERALTFASMDTPGPYETVATEAFFNVTLPDPSFTPKQVEEHMSAFNRGTIISTAIHEAYPGHYTQFLWMQKISSKVRRLLGASSNGEGWAHYCEQMMLDEGYGGGDPKLRLGQIQDALLRNARYIVGVEMHTGAMTYAQGVEFFIKEGYQQRVNAERETKRGTSDPTYLYYTLGKLQILKLRDDYKARRGDAFSLGEFHDRLMEQGFPPLAIVRRALLGNDSPTL